MSTRNPLVRPLHIPRSYELPERLTVRIIQVRAVISAGRYWEDVMNSVPRAVIRVVAVPFESFDPRKDYGRLTLLANTGEVSLQPLVSLDLGLLMHAWDNPVVRLADTLAHTLAFIGVQTTARTERARQCLERLAVNLDDLREHAKELGRDQASGERLRVPIQLEAQDRLELRIDQSFPEPLSIVLHCLEQAPSSRLWESPLPIPSEG